MKKALEGTFNHGSFMAATGKPAPKMEAARTMTARHICISQYFKSMMPSITAPFGCDLHNAATCSGRSYSPGSSPDPHCGFPPFCVKLAGAADVAAARL